ncbi:MAG: DNA polymerase III subunit beta [Oscillospiraceae bacterium]|nr:DNA polymerase III subunit beta [Oscillospiraceae bacterium]
MKFSVDKNFFYEAVSSASKACALKSALNILDGVLLNLTDNVLTVTGYDLEIGIRVSIEVDGQNDGNVVTDPRLLSEMVKKMPGNIVNFELIEGKSIKITSGKSKLSLPCKSGEEFPNIIEIQKDVSFDISEKLLKEMLLRVGFAVSRTSQELECIKMEIEDNTFYSVATDGNRLAAKYCNIQNENINFTIPDKAVSSLIKSLSDSGDDDATVNIAVDKNQICVSKRNYVLISRLLEGKFVNYRRIIESDFPRVLKLNPLELIKSMDRCLLLMSDKLKIPVTCSIINDIMKISCKTTLGSIDEEIPIVIKEGDFTDFNINFNPRFMLEALQKVNTEEIMISFDGVLKPFKITPLDDNGDFIFVIVPIRSG